MTLKSCAGSIAAQAAPIALTGKTRRAKNVALIFADAATGAHSPALVSQGKIAQVIAAKPAERRQMLEEAAGIAGLHVRRRDAEAKLRQTEANLARLDDLNAGMTAQIASLTRQARQADRYRDLSDRIRSAEAALVFVRWRDAQTAAAATESHAHQARDKVLRYRQLADQAQDAQRLAAAGLTAAQIALADRRDAMNAKAHLVSTIAMQLETANERIADLARQKERLDEDRADADRVTQEAAEAMLRLDEQISADLAALARDEDAHPGHVAALAQAQTEADRLELALAQSTAEHAQVEADWRIASEQRDAAERSVVRLEEREQERTRQLHALGDPSTSDRAIAQAEARQEGAARRVAEGRASLKRIQDRIGELRRSHEAAAAASAAAAAEHAAAKREHDALLRDREERKRRLAHGEGVPTALDMVQAKPGFERALAAVLGRDAGTPLRSDRAGSDARAWTGAPVVGHIEHSLLQHVRRCPDALRARLAMVHVVGEDDDRVLGKGEWLVTMDGVLRRWDGLIAQGEGNSGTARLEADNRFDDLVRSLPGLEKDAADRAAQSTAIGQALQAAAADRAAAEATLAQDIEREREAARERDRADTARERIEQQRVDLSAAQTRDADALAQARIALSVASQMERPDARDASTALERARTANAAARTTVLKESAALAAQDLAVAVARERLASRRQSANDWKTRSGDAATRLAAMASRVNDLSNELARIADEPARLRTDIGDAETTYKRLAKELTAQTIIVHEAQAALCEADGALAEATETLLTARESLGTLRAQANNELARLEELARISGERFQCPPAMLPSRFGFAETGDAKAAAMSQELERLTAARERIGPVNLVAGEEIARLEDRHGANIAERRELEQAVNRLRASIGSLNREGRERLQQAFEQVDGHFRRLFQRLFAGGQAHLALIDSDDPLEAGLEIFAQPPGKRLQSLSLLSGGEQALTAIALIFGLFLTNPAPICVLDEVDAPLDDANIERFCDLLDTMARETRTRYLIVSHNAVTMSRMDRLFGVTMTEPGISRLVSVDLQRAEDLLAAE